MPPQNLQPDDQRQLRIIPRGSGLSSRCSARRTSRRDQLSCFQQRLGRLRAQSSAAPPAPSTRSRSPCAGSRSAPSSALSAPCLCPLSAAVQGKRLKISGHFSVLSFLSSPLSHTHSSASSNSTPAEKYTMVAVAFGGAGKEAHGITELRLGKCSVWLQPPRLPCDTPRGWGCRSAPRARAQPAQAECRMQGAPVLNDWLEVYRRVINNVHFQSLSFQSLLISRGVEQVLCDSSSA